MTPYGKNIHYPLTTHCSILDAVASIREKNLDGTYLFKKAKNLDILTVIEISPHARYLHLDVQNENY